MLYLSLPIRPMLSDVTRLYRLLFLGTGRAPYRVHVIMIALKVQNRIIVLTVSPFNVFRVILQIRIGSDFHDYVNLHILFCLIQKRPQPFKKTNEDAQTYHSSKDIVGLLLGRTDPFLG